MLFGAPQGMQQPKLAQPLGYGDPVDDAHGAGPAVGELALARREKRDSAVGQPTGVVVVRRAGRECLRLAGGQTDLTFTVPKAEYEKALELRMKK